ncbi:MAG TPA: ABC transporter permease, partial [Thermoanaerobaculia bacterium]|nr:ABC transporter permease [Thermoanaerobaculia bacterium]
MSEIVSAAVPARSSLPWGHWWRQLLAIIRLELRKGFRRSYGLFLLALSPLFIFFMRLVLASEVISDPSDVAGATEFFAATYQAFILRIIIFLGCVAIFGNMIRRETLDRSLHYYFLAPVRRELLVVAKFLTGLIVAVLLFGLTTVLGFFLTYMPHE